MQQCQVQRLLPVNCFNMGERWGEGPCQQRATARGQCTDAAKHRGAGKHMAQVGITYQIHCLNQEKEKPLVLCSSKDVPALVENFVCKYNFFLLYTTASHK